MAQKIPIHLGDGDLLKINSLVSILGLKDTYGAYPRAIKFSIDLALDILNRYSKFIPRLETSKQDLFISSIIRLQAKQVAKEMARIAQEKAEKV